MPDIAPRPLDEPDLEQLLNSNESAAVLEAVLGATPSGALIARTPDGVILRVSDYAARLHERPQSDLLGYGLADDFGPTPVYDGSGRRLTAAERPLGRALRGETVTGFELVVETPRGERIPLGSSAAPIRNAHGKLIGAISAITDLRPYKALEQSLHENEQQFRDLANSLPQMVWVTDPNGEVLWQSRRADEYFGARRGLAWRKALHPDHLDRVVAGVQRALAIGEYWEDTFPLRSSAGHYRWFLSRGLPIKDSKGRVTKWFGSDTDVTDQIEAQELLRTLLKEVSHRVKNSLALVSSLLKLQARALEGDARRALEEASLRVNAVASVHDQLWRSADAREIDLKPYLSDLCSTIAATAARHRTTWSVEPAMVGSELAVPLGVFVNELLTNAYKHAYPEGEEGEVRILGTRAPEGRYRLEVADSGRGIPPDFEVAKAVTSLGMRMVTGLAAQLGGELTVKTLEPGASFTLEFPLSSSTS